MVPFGLALRLFTWIFVCYMIKFSECHRIRLMPTLHNFRTRLWIGSLYLSCQLLLGVPRPYGLESCFPEAYAGLLAALESIF